MNPILNTAFKAARKAGDLMIRASKDLGNIKTDSKAFNDFVSDIDRMSENILIETLLEAYPQHKITAEESGSHGNPNGAYEWIIDPLDGTTNYLHGHPQYAISMALLHNGKLQEALVYAPERIDLPQCLIGTGFPVVDQSRTDTYLAILKDFLSQTAGARREGAASLDLCALACGRFDGFFEFNLKPWDIAAGALIAREAGAVVTDMTGEQGWLESGDIVAANPKVLAQMLQIIGNHIG